MMICIESGNFRITIDNPELERLFFNRLFSNVERNIEQDNRIEKCTKNEKVDNVNDNNNDSWKKLTILTKRLGYKRDGNDVVFCHVRDDEVRPIFRISTDELRDLFEELPEKTTKLELFETAKRLGIKIPVSHYQQIMHFYDKDINYNAHLEKDGVTNVLVKDDISLRDEVKKQLEVDNELTRDAV